MIVLDAAAAFWACGERGRFERFGPAPVGPPLLWSELHSALREKAWRGELTADDALAHLRRFSDAGVRRIDRDDLHPAAWRVAERFGWAKTYDAEYVALAGLLGCRLVTLDARLRRGADRLGYVVAVHEL